MAASKPSDRTAKGKYRVFLAGIILGCALGVSGTWLYSYLNTEVFSYTDTYDYNHDGEDDTYLYYEHGRLVAASEDRNFDGRKDIWHSYDNRGVIERSKADDSFDGDIDAWYEYSNGVVSIRRMDLDHNNKIDLIEEYRFGLLEKQKWFGVNSSKIRRLCFFERGIKREEHLDQDNDGEIDTVVYFDRYERQGRKEKLKNE